MARTGQVMTADEFLALPEAPFRFQLVEGSLVVNERKLPHQIAVANVLVALMTWRRSGPAAAGFDVVEVVGAHDTLTSPLLPGFGIVAGDLFMP